MIDARTEAYRNVHQLAVRSVRKVPLGSFVAVHVEELAGRSLLGFTVEEKRVGFIQWNDLVGKEPLWS